MVSEGLPTHKQRRFRWLTGNALTVCLILWSLIHLTERIYRYFDTEYFIGSFYQLINHDFIFGREGMHAHYPENFYVVSAIFWTIFLVCSLSWFGARWSLRILIVCFGFELIFIAANATIFGLNRMAFLEKIAIDIGILADAAGIQKLNQMIVSEMRIVLTSCALQFSVALYLLISVVRKLRGFQNAR